MRKKKAGEKAKEKNKDYCVTFDFFTPSLRTQTYSGRGLILSTRHLSLGGEKRRPEIRLRSQAISIRFQTKTLEEKKIIVLTEDLVKLFITNCKSLIFRILE